MGYQALLFSPDEKLARVVSQVFTELDFTVEPAHEPFGAVKKLMAQRYDAIVVDCDNEQNASLLFKSARNSSFNQSSLAIALVEGQAGVAKAYRIGANLVLTKPINVEQAKGTLRVARGLLRKTSDAADGSATSCGSPTMPQAPAQCPAPVRSPTRRSRAAAALDSPPPSRPEPPEFEAPLSAATPETFPRASSGFTARSQQRFGEGSGGVLRQGPHARPKVEDTTGGSSARSAKPRSHPDYDGGRTGPASTASRFPGQNQEQSQARSTQSRTKQQESPRRPHRPKIPAPLSPARDQAQHRSGKGSDSAASKRERE